MTQLSMFEAEEPGSPPAMGADPERVRRKLAAMLAEAREAGPFGLPENRRRFMQTVVPQMARWLPEDEAQRIKDDLGHALAG